MNLWTTCYSVVVHICYAMLSLGVSYVLISGSTRSWLIMFTPEYVHVKNVGVLKLNLGWVGTVVNRAAKS